MRTLNDELRILDIELEQANHRFFNKEYLSPIDDYDDYTCSRCNQSKNCEYAFDAYNTNDDCLASK